MDALDGNAIGGMLIDVFGTDMTAASSTCGTCGAIRPMAELLVYMRAPGIVVRCRTCGSVMMVFVKAHGVTCAVDLAGMAGLSRTEATLSRARRNNWSVPWPAVRVLQVTQVALVSEFRNSAGMTISCTGPSSRSGVLPLWISLAAARADSCPEAASRSPAT
jgi:hypothetical protein